MTEQRTPAQIYALAFGITLVIAGIAGFFVDSSFDTGNNVQGDDLIVFEVTGIHNLVHIASGLLGLALAGTPRGAKAYALGFGVVYLLVVLVGIADGEDFLGLFPVNAADNVLHIVISLTGIAAGLASRDEPRERVGPAR